MTGTADHRWRILRTGAHDACWNMALDETLFRGHTTGNASPVFRVYEWKRPAITVGHGQRVADLLDPDACARDNIDVTRRLTGGRAVFHTREVGYTVIGSIRDSIFGGGIRDTYRAINAVIVPAYRSLGMTVAESHPRNLPDIAPGLRHAAPCFASPAPFELSVDGMKLTGGAQRRTGGTFLQQGTVRLGPGAERIADYLIDRTTAMVFRRRLEPDAVFRDMNLPPLSMTDALISAFALAVGGAVDDDTVARHECDEAERLSLSRYRAKGWIDGTGYEPDF